MVSGSENLAIIASVGGRQRRLATPRHWRAAIKKGEIGRDTSVTLERGGLAAQIVTAGEIPELQDLFDEILPTRPAPPPSPPPPASAHKVVAPAPARKQEAKPASETAAASADASSAHASPVDQQAVADTMPPDDPARDRPTGCSPSAVFFLCLVSAFPMLIFVSIGNDDIEYQDVMVNEPAYEEPAYEAPALDDYVGKLEDGTNWEDISSYFRTDRNFCYDLFSNNEAIIPEGLEPQEIEIEIGSAYPAKNSLYRFEAKLEGLTVVGYSEIISEGYDPITIIFDDPIEEVLERLSPVYSPIFPTSPSRNASVDYMDDEFYLNIEAFDQEATVVRNSFGRSSLSCFVRH